jgi:hypothetical protein
MPEYRLHISVPGLPLEAEAGWEPLIGRLEREHARLGPILSWDQNVACITLATDADDEADAVRIGVDAVVSTLRSCGLGAHYPASVELEDAGHLTPA